MISTGQLSLAQSCIVKSSTSFAWDKGGKVTGRQHSVITYGMQYPVAVWFRLRNAKSNLLTNCTTLYVSVHSHLCSLMSFIRWLDRLRSSNCWTSLRLDTISKTVPSSSTLARLDSRSYGNLCWYLLKQTFAVMLNIQPLHADEKGRFKKVAYCPGGPP